VGEELLKPTRIYVKGMLKAIGRNMIKGAAHITGGGFIENIPRMLPEGLTAEIKMGSWPVLPVFKLIQEWGNIDEMEMFNTFNMGIGMVLACSPEHAEDVADLFCQEGYPAYIIGKVKSGTRGVVFVP